MDRRIEVAQTQFVALDKEYKEENVEILAWMTVKGTYQDTEHVKFKTLPAVKVASCIIKGSYAQMNDVSCVPRSLKVP